MASKKDKFRKEVKKSLGQEDPSMEGIVGEIAGRRTEKSRKDQASEATEGKPAREADSSEQRAAPSEATESAEPTEMAGVRERAQSDESSETASKSRSADGSRNSEQKGSNRADEEVSEPGGPEFLSEVEADGEGSTGAATVGGNGQPEDRKASTAADSSGNTDESSRSNSSQSHGSEGTSDRKDRENRPSSGKKDRMGGSERIDSTGHSKKTGARSMARKRESIYNVSSDIRLEDYTEADRQKSNNSMFKVAGVVAVLIIIGFVIWQAATWLMAPAYQLAISNQEITAANIEQLATGPVSRLSATAPVHIRFQWEPGELQTDYLKIMVEREEGSAFIEEAVLGRRPPRTASYIYFMGPLDSGKYRIQVLDASGSVLADRDLELQ